MQNQPPIGAVGGWPKRELVSGYVATAYVTPLVRYPA